MCVHIYIYIYIYMYVCIYIYIYIYISNINFIASTYFFARMRTLSDEPDGPQGV